MSNLGMNKWSFKGDGIVVFYEPYQAIKANKILRCFGLDCKIISPPPKMRMGCAALGLEIDLKRKEEAESLFKNHGIDFQLLEAL
ncbi:MAG: DUF3343 domain-containing protein [Dehalococcoidia bacterium]|nr:DUF3343 domain-containing protein [Dehalococcoidia bacterium]